MLTTAVGPLNDVVKRERRMRVYDEDIEAGRRKVLG